MKHALFSLLGILMIQNILADDTGPASHPFTLGASLEDVILQAGAPTDVRQYGSLNEVVMIYGDSYVRLRDDRVFRWMNAGDLSHVAEPGAMKALITKGSSKRDVLAIHDKPDRTRSFRKSGIEVLYYGDSYIRLKHDQVADWFNEGSLSVLPDQDADKLGLIVLKNKVIDEEQRKQQEASSLRFKTQSGQIQVPSAWASRPFSAPTASSSSRSSSTRSSRTTSRSTGSSGSNAYNNNSRNSFGSSSSFNNRNSSSYNNRNSRSYNSRNSNSSYNRNIQVTR